jgi:hypothetical protein
MKNPLQMDAERQAKWEEKYREAVRPHVTDEPLAVGVFQRTGQWFLAIPLVGQIMGLVLFLFYQAFHRSRAAGLPSTFLLAVTPTTVHAFKYSAAYGRVKVKKEVATFARDSIRVSGAGGGTLSSKVTFEVADDGETTRITCSIPMPSQNPFSTRVVEVLSGAAAAPGPSAG